MPLEARNRAQRCRAHAEECLRLAAIATDPATKKHYQLIADEYLTVATAEEHLALKIEQSGVAIEDGLPR